MATAVRVRFPPSAPARHQGLWQVAATLSFLLFRAVQQAHPVPCFSCLYEFGLIRWYKRCLKCHPLPLLPLTRTALATPTQQPVVPAIIFFAWAASSIFVVLCLLLPKNVLLFPLVAGQQGMSCQHAALFRTENSAILGCNKFEEYPQ